MVKLDAGRLSIPFGYVFFLGAVLHLTPCVGQVNTGGQLFRDSLHRHISREKHVESAYYLSYPQGKSFIFYDLDDNAAELDRLDAFLRMALSHPDLYVGHVYLTGFCSIEGAYHVNNRLSRERVEQFYLYLRKLHPEIFEYDHSIASVAEDWQGLSGLVRASSLTERGEILDIIRKVSSFDERERLLRQLNGGHAFRYMEKHFFPQLRKVELRIEYRLTPKVMPAVSGPLVSEVIPSADMDIQSVILGLTNTAVTRSRRTFNCPTPLLGIKTNLLLLAGLQNDLDHTTFTPNLSLEYYITPNWSVELGAMYSYWHYNHHRNFQGLSGYRIEPRFRILLGNWGVEGFMGTYFRFGDYDRRSVDSAQPTVNYQLSTVKSGSTGRYFQAGLSGGFFFPVWRNFGLEVGARAGYVSTHAIKYTPDEQGRNVYSSRQRYNKFRVTDLNVNLVYRIK